MTQHSAYITAC